MLIGEISKRTGLSRDTIRFYEKHGLITVGFRERRQNNYKEYSEQTLSRLISIKLIKGLGFTLNETAELLEMIELNQASCENVAAKIDNKVLAIDEKVKELLHMRNMLLSGVERCSQRKCKSTYKEENCPVLIPTTN